jgi:multimeric flavodoxin WrbA
MKKVVALFGSPHKNGVTYKLLNEFLISFDKTDFDVETVSVFEENVAPCIDCASCKSSYGCVLKQNKELFRMIEQADYIIMAVPVYLLSMPAPLKALFDRFQQYYNAHCYLNLVQPIKKPKRAFLILTAGSGSSEGANIMIRQAELAFSVMNTKIGGSFVLKDTDKLGDDEMQQALKEIKIKAEELITEA